MDNPMTLQDVKAWICDGKVAKAKNPYTDESKYVEFYEWATMNQPSTELTGNYRADEVEVKELWEWKYLQGSLAFKPVKQDVIDRFSDYESFNKVFLDNNADTRLRYTLIKKGGREEIKPDYEKITPIEALKIVQYYFSELKHNPHHLVVNDLLKIDAILAVNCALINHKNNL